MAIKIPIISEFNPKGIEAAVKQFQTLTSASDKAAFALKKMALPAAAAFAAVTAGGLKAAQAASDLNETISKTNVIFGQASKSVQDFANTAARTLGQSKQEALDAAASFGIFGKAAGKTGEDLAAFSIEMTKLSSDLASFHNANPAEVALALGAALRGESEPIRRFGVLLNDAAIKAKAMQMGLYDGTGALDQQAKVLAVQKLILEQTTDAQGDFARTSSGAANQQRILRAALADATVSIGQAFLPILEKVLPVLVNFGLMAERNSGLIAAMATALAVLAGAILAANTAMVAWKGISVITAAVNYALAASFTAVQIATGIGILAVAAGTAAFIAYKRSMAGAVAETNRLANSTTNLNKAFIGPQLSPEQLSKMSKEFYGFGEETGKAAPKVESFAKALKDKLGEALQKAQDDLQKAKDAFSSFATNIADSVKQAFSFGDAQEAGQETGAGFLDGLRSQVVGVVGYAKKIQELLDKNLSKDALAKVLEAGAEAGMAIADQLIAGGQAAIDETNALVDSANAAAEKVGMNAASKWFQGGIDTAQKMVDGIQLQLDKLTPKLMEKMDAIAAKMKRTVDIDVRVTETVSRIVSTIAAGGIPKMGDGGIVQRPTLALIGEAGPEAVVPLSKMNAGGGDVNININGGLATSAEIGQSVVNALRAYSRSAGPLALNIA